MPPILPSGGAHWIEPAGSGASSSAQLAYLVLDGAGDWTYSTTGPAQADWIDWQGNGDAELLVLTPARIVADAVPGDLLVTTSTASAVAAILADAGSGDIEVTTDLTRTAIADLYLDAAGNLVVVRRTATRRTAMQVSGGVIIY
jgi:hypothetical protein